MALATHIIKRMAPATHVLHLQTNQDVRMECVDVWTTVHMGEFKQSKRRILVALSLSNHSPTPCASNTDCLVDEKIIF